MTGYDRPAWVEVDHEAIAHNVRALMAMSGPATMFMAVVKADGYGHGHLECARAALRAGAQVLGVATVEEAVALREAGVVAPVHLLSEPPESAAPAVVRHSLVPALFTRDFALALSAAAVREQRPAEFHLKVDTGMNRIGVRAEEACEFVMALAGTPGLRMTGVFTHFATSEVLGDWDFETQTERFARALRAMRDEGVHTGVVHAANSGATILRPESRHDMVRCGIAIYGLHPGEDTRGRVDLRPAMSVKARVSRVQRVQLGEGVSYGMTWRAARPTDIATLPLGYADGVHRLLSNRMRVLIGGVSCQQVGRVCMDQLMVEVPQGHQVVRGDEAVIVGEQGGERITMDEVAQGAETIAYETACAFGMRMERRPAPAR